MEQSSALSSAEEHHQFIGTIVAMLMRAGRWTSQEAERPGGMSNNGTGELESFEAVRKSVKQHETLADYSRERAFDLDDQEAVRRIQARLGRLMPIVSSKGQDGRQTKSTQRTHNSNDDTGLSTNEFVAAGRLGWLRAPGIASEESGWSRLRTSADNVCASSGEPRAGGTDDMSASAAALSDECIAGRKGKPPVHLRGIRPRTQRLNDQLIGEAHRRAELVLDKLAQSDASGLTEPDAWLRVLPPAVQSLVKRWCEVQSVLD